MRIPLVHVECKTIVATFVVGQPSTFMEAAMVMDDHKRTCKPKGWCTYRDPSCQTGVCRCA